MAAREECTAAVSPLWSEQEPPVVVQEEPEGDIGPTDAASEAESVAKAEEVDGPEETEAVPEFIMHKLEEADTLYGLELRYGVPASEIKRANYMMSDRLTAYFELKIPLWKQRKPGTNYVPVLAPPDQDHELDFFARVLRSRSPGISREEAAFYHRESDGDASRALKLLNGDIEWEEKMKARGENSANACRKVCKSPFLCGWLFSTNRCRATTAKKGFDETRDSDNLLLLDGSDERSHRLLDFDHLGPDENPGVHKKL